jgi:hypothetical protein
MASISHEPAEASSAEQRRYLRLRVPDMWASLAIAVMWLAVLFDAIYGPDIVSNTVTSTTRIPSAIVVALFAYLATRVVARYGFGPTREGKV